jgi:hypothetical protein
VSDRDGALRPAVFCRELLVSLEGSEGRRKKRKRDTSADAIGLAMKRDLLERAMRDDPEPDDFEGWLLEQCLSAGPGSGGVRAMALSIWDEWVLVRHSDGYREWLARGAPSDDRISATRQEAR